MAKIQDCLRNSSPMILIGNQMVYSPKGSENYKDLDKTRVKLFPNFTGPFDYTDESRFSFCKIERRLLKKFT